MNTNKGINYPSDLSHPQVVYLNGPCVVWQWIDNNSLLLTCCVAGPETIGWKARRGSFRQLITAVLTLMRLLLSADRASLLRSEARRFVN